MSTQPTLVARSFTPMSASKNLKANRRKSCPAGTYDMEAHFPSRKEVPERNGLNRCELNINVADNKKINIKSAPITPIIVKRKHSLDNHLQTLKNLNLRFKHTNQWIDFLQTEGEAIEEFFKSNDQLTEERKIHPYFQKASQLYGQRKKLQQLLNSFSFEKPEQPFELYFNEQLKNYVPDPDFVKNPSREKLLKKFSKQWETISVSEKLRFHAKEPDIILTGPSSLQDEVFEYYAIEKFDEYLQNRMPSNLSKTETDKIMEDIHEEWKVLPIEIKRDYAEELRLIQSEISPSIETAQRVIIHKLKEKEITPPRETVVAQGKSKIRHKESSGDRATSSRPTLDPATTHNERKSTKKFKQRWSSYSKEQKLKEARTFCNQYTPILMIYETMQQEGYTVARLCT